MSSRAFLPGERHHWWPSSLSKFWTDGNGKISRIDTKGKITRSTSIRTARISNGHNIKAWGTTFEQEFQRPDDNFPRVVQLLETLVKNHHESTSLDRLGFCMHTCEELDLQTLCECIVSLAVRSPNFRQDTVNLVEYLRSNVQKKEHKSLIATNIQQTYNLLSKDFSGRGKFLIVFSDQAEFIFGDGFYQNISSGSAYLFYTRILVPFTPKVSVLYAIPMHYMVEPRVVTLQANDELVVLFNEMIQIYSKDYLFYRSEKPALLDHFLRQEHLVYEDGDPDPIATLVEKIPGVKP